MNGTLNKVMLIGHTGDDVKMHYFENGNCVGRFPLATNETYTTRNGDRVNNVEWHNIVVNNKLAEIFEKYVKKGDRIYIEGRIRYRKWADDKGVERYSTEIAVREFTFLTPKEGANMERTPNQGVNPQAATQNQQSPNPVSDQNHPPASEEDVDDLPF